MLFIKHKIIKKIDKEVPTKHHQQLKYPYKLHDANWESVPGDPNACFCLGIGAKWAVSSTNS